jgi:hypothetical protein
MIPIPVKGGKIIIDTHFLEMLLGVILTKEMTSEYDFSTLL